MDQQKAKILLHKYNTEQCSAEEKALVESWFLAATENKTDELPIPDHELVEAEIWGHIQLQTNSEKTVRPLWKRLSVAASLLLLLCSGILLWKFDHKAVAIKDQYADVIRPGGNNAILTLSNGKQIALQTQKNGVIANDGSNSIKKTADGKITYQAQALQKNTDEAISYNTITTPRGGRYELSLSDGTVAILDAASSIRYPVSFAQKERRVEITGQVYFEVVHNSSKRFIVKVKDQLIEDLGTHFNINAYDDEPLIKTSLLEGSIQVNNNKGAVILKPGQQARIKAGNANDIEVVNANMEEVVAWKNDDFMFDKEDIKTVMHKIARWYDVEVVYKGEVPSDAFTATISRYKNVEKVLNTLQLTGRIHYKIEGRRVIIMQ